MVPLPTLLSLKAVYVAGLYYSTETRRAWETLGVPSRVSPKLYRHASLGETGCRVGALMGVQSLGATESRHG